MRHRPSLFPSGRHTGDFIYWDGLRLLRFKCRAQHGIVLECNKCTWIPYSCYYSKSNTKCRMPSTQMTQLPFKSSQRYSLLNKQPSWLLIAPRIFHMLSTMPTANLNDHTLKTCRFTVLRRNFHGKAHNTPPITHTDNASYTVHFTFTFLEVKDDTRKLLRQHKSPDPIGHNGHRTARVIQEFNL